MQRWCGARTVQTRPLFHARPTRRPAIRTRHNRARSTTISADIAAGTTLVGIDLGTSNSAISVNDDGKSIILLDDQGCAVTPSVVSYTEDAVAVGRAAAGGDPANTFYSVKRLIGRSLGEVATDLEDLRYQVTAASDEDLPGDHQGADAQNSSNGSSDDGSGGGGGGLRLQCPARGGTLAPEEVSAELLRDLLSRAEAYLGRAVTNAVVTVPAHFGDVRRKATHRAARLAGLQAVHLLQEPVAAAIAYGLGRPQEADTILVVDLGGGTLDISILESFEGIIEVLTSDGDSKLGGDDFDRAVAHWALQQCRQAGHALSDKVVSGIMPSAEAAKVALSSAEEAAVSVPLPDGGYFNAALSRGEFEALIQPLLRRIWAPMERAGSAVFLEWADRPFQEEQTANGSGSSVDLGRFAPPPRRITKALLVGGGTHVPAVQRLVEHVTGITPDTSLDPELCVAIGAGIQAGILEGVVDEPLEVMDGAYVQNLHGRITGVSGFETV